ncbi:MAG: hypothetical protein SangKO_044670 [Sandaracinaceae bacterium]
MRHSELPKVEGDGAVGTAQRFPEKSHMTDHAPDLRVVPPPAEDPPDPLIGTTLEGRYAIERILGKGGMGLVYEARHVVLNKRLAVKVLKEEVSRDEQVMARFRREAQSASAIGSPHICDVSDFGSLPDGSTYFVMEFLDGPSLSAAIESQRPMDVQRIVDVGMQLCDALGAAHERGIVHRDLKPDNVHLVKQGQRVDFVKVLDFGIAKVGDGGNKKLTQAGQVFGTPHYMSPEQCSGREVDHRTDLYALGVMLYEMATGKVPFDADNLMGVLTKHVYERPIPPREVLPPPASVPPGLEAVILRCLEKQPEARYATMAELKADLARVASGSTPDAVMRSVSGVPRTQMIGERPSAIEMSPATPDALPAETESSKSPVAWIVVAALSLVVLGGGAFAAAFFLFGDDALPASDTTTASTETPEVEPTPEIVPEIAAPPSAETPETPPAAPAAAETISLSSTPEGAQVWTADGVLLGNTPFEIPRPADGERVELELRQAGHEDTSVVLAHLSQPALRITLPPTRQPAARRAPRARPSPVAAPAVRPLAPPAPRPRPTTQESEIINPW